MKVTSTGECALEPTEIAALFTSTACAALGVWYVLWLVKRSGEDRGFDNKIVERVVATAPFERLDNILPPSKR